MRSHTAWKDEFFGEIHDLRAGVYIIPGVYSCTGTWNGYNYTAERQQPDCLITVALRTSPLRRLRFGLPPLLLLLLLVRVYPSRRKGTSTIRRVYSTRKVCQDDILLC